MAASRSDDDWEMLGGIVGVVLFAIVVLPVLFVFRFFKWSKASSRLAFPRINRKFLRIALIVYGSVVSVVAIFVLLGSYELLPGFMKTAYIGFIAWVRSVQANWWSYGGWGLKGIFAKAGGILLISWFFMFPLNLLLELWRDGKRGRVLLRAKKKMKPYQYLIGLSADDSKPRFLSNAMRSEHLLVLGSTGTGKTTSALEPAIQADIEQGRGLIFVTAKDDPDFLRRVYSHAVQLGREDKVRIFTLSDTSKSDSYNPLSIRDETALRDLCFEAFTWDNVYYRDQAKSALLYVLSAMVESEKAFTLMDLYYTFTEKGCLDLLCEQSQEERTKHHLKGYSNDWKKFRENMRGLAANLEDYTTRKLAKILCTTNPDIDLGSIYDEKGIAIFVLNSFQYGETARRLGKMLIQDIRLLSGKIMERERAPFFPVYIDEFHHFVHPEFFAMVAQCRSANIGIMLSTQSFADMKGDTWDITAQVVQNTNTKLILRQNDADSAEYAARLAGTRTTRFVTDQLEDGLIGQRRTGLSSVRAQEEFVIHPNLIRSLGTGVAALIWQGWADIVELNQAVAPETFYDPDQRSGVQTRAVIRESLDIYGRWRTLEGVKKGEGIRRPTKREPAKEAKGIDAIRAKMKDATS